MTNSEKNSENLRTHETGTIRLLLCYLCPWNFAGPILVYFAWGKLKLAVTVLRMYVYTEARYLDVKYLISNLC